MADFASLLKEHGLSKTQLAHRLGIRAEAVSRWGDDPPFYATAYLALLREMREGFSVRDRLIEELKAKAGLQNLERELVQGILETPDDEIMAEVEASGESVGGLAERADEVIEKARKRYDPLSTGPNPFVTTKKS